MAAPLDVLQKGSRLFPLSGMAGVSRVGARPHCEANAPIRTRPHPEPSTTTLSSVAPEDTWPAFLLSRLSLSVST